MFFLRAAGIPKPILAFALGLPDFDRRTSGVSPIAKERGMSDAEIAREVPTIEGSTAPEVTHK